MKKIMILIILIGSYNVFAGSGSEEGLDFDPNTRELLGLNSPSTLPNEGRQDVWEPQRISDKIERVQERDLSQLLEVITKRYESVRHVSTGIQTRRKRDFSCVGMKSAIEEAALSGELTDSRANLVALYDAPETNCAQEAGALCQTDRNIDRECMAALDNHVESAAATSID